ncbi:jasmonate-amino synthetase [Aureococcus anophagefferens]|nr:jasmonate-amino synthetase [Aureococcus anophagefferens]
MSARRAAAVGAAAVAVQVGRFASRDRAEETHTLSTAVQQFFMFDALRVAGAYARWRHDQDCAGFEDTQAALLKSLLERNKDTAYGVDRGFAAIAAADDVVAAFRAAHPLTTYADVAPYVDRIYEHGGPVLNASPERMLAATSGTSGRVALLPTTPEMSSTFFARGILVVFDVLNRLGHLDHLQRTTKLAFQPRHREAPSGLRVGPNSSGPKDPSFERLRPLLYSTPKAGYAVEDEASALYVHCLFAARDRDLGVLEAPPGVPLEAALGPGDAARAGEIRAALGDGAAGFALRLWPKLKLILANATGAFEPHARRLRAGAGVPIRSTILAASEGLMGVSLEPRDDGEAAYCLVPRAMVFEFLPAVLNARGEKTSEAQLQAAVDRALPDVAVFAAVERADDVEAPGYDLLAPLGGGDRRGPLDAALARKIPSTRPGATRARSRRPSSST